MTDKIMEQILLEIVLRYTKNKQLVTASMASRRANHAQKTE